MITPAAAIADRSLLGSAFAGPSWEAWRAILKAAYAEPLDDAELALFRTVAGDRPPPRRRVRELIVIAGRRSGKDSIASAIATTAAMADYSPRLRPGERASVLCLAVDREQARIVNRYIAGYFRTNPLLMPLVVRETDDGMELTNSVEVVVATNSYRSVRGRTVACAIFDEAAFWRDEDSATPDIETYSAIMPAMVTLPGAMLVIITTAYRRAGLAFQKWAAHFGKDDDDVLVVYGPSTTFNPSLPQSVIDAALARDPEAAGAEWLSQWRSDLSDFLDRELIAAATDAGVVVRPPRSGVRYVAFADPSGGRGDSFTLGIAHAEGNAAIVDCLYEKRAPFDPSVVVAEIAALLRGYSLAEATGDRYAAGWVTEGFAKEGVRYVQSERDRSALYLDALPLFTAGRARILDNARLMHQLTSLERRTSRFGKDRVDHPPGGADDLANSACGALVLASSVAAPTLWRRADLLSDSVPTAWPTRALAVYASGAVDGTGAVIAFWAYDAARYGSGGRCLLIDFERLPMGPALFGGVRGRLAELAAAKVPRRHGGYLIACVPQIGRSVVTAELAAYALGAGIVIDRTVAPIVAAAANRETVLLTCGTEIASGRVKISDLADQRAMNQPNPLTEIRPGAAPSAALDCALLAVIASVPRTDWPREWRAPRAA